MIFHRIFVNRVLFWFLLKNKYLLIELTTVYLVVMKIVKPFQYNEVKQVEVMIPPWCLNN